MKRILFSFSLIVTQNNFCMHQVQENNQESVIQEGIEVSLESSSKIKKEFRRRLVQPENQDLARRVAQLAGRNSIWGIPDKPMTWKMPKDYSKK